MSTQTMTGPLAFFLIGVAFLLVVAALFVIGHALGRRADRWKHPWMRWIWALLAAEYILAFAGEFIFKNELAATIFGISYVVALVVDVAYLLRVVFPARREMPTGTQQAALHAEELSSESDPADDAFSG